MKTIQVNSVQECGALHTSFLNQFVEDAWNALLSAGTFKFDSRISSDRNGWVSSIAYGDIKYTGTGKAISNALYEELVMPCDWLALTWRDAFRLNYRHKRESDSGYLTILSVIPGYKITVADKNRFDKIFENCKTMCRERKFEDEGKTKIFS